MSIKSTIATLARATEALLIVSKPNVKGLAEQGVYSVEERVGSDADRALPCGRPCGHLLAHNPLPALLAVADGHLSRVAAHGGWAE